MRNVVPLTLAVACLSALLASAADEKPAGSGAGPATRPAEVFKPDADGKVVIFNGRDLSGWEGDPQYWSVRDGEIVAHADRKHGYSYLTSTRAAEDFRLVLQIKLTPNAENSGVQFRSERLAGRNGATTEEMRGPQADVGKGYWGHLYEEHARGLLTKESGERWVKADDWNTYEILAVGSKVRTALNGHLCVDLDDPKIARRGIFGLQMHVGGPMEVRFRRLELELNPPFELKTLGHE